MCLSGIFTSSDRPWLNAKCKPIPAAQTSNGHIPEPSVLSSFPGRALVILELKGDPGALITGFSLQVLAEHRPCCEIQRIRVNLKLPSLLPTPPCLRLPSEMTVSGKDTSCNLVPGHTQHPGCSAAQHLLPRLIQVNAFTSILNSWSCAP